MATPRQLAANRQNAQKSTGPVTAEGKDASRRNALTHGLAGDGGLVPDDLMADVRKRMAEWRPNFELQTPEQEWLFEQAVVNSIRLDRCHEQEQAIRLNERRRAALCWDDDRRSDAERIAGGLSRRPEAVIRRLQQTRQGVEWMIDRWRALGESFDRLGEWTEAQRTMALDLIGTPVELRDLVPIDDPQTLVVREVAHLERRKARSLDALDAFEREAAEAGRAVAPSQTLSTLRRYEATCLRNYLWATHQLQQRRLASPTIDPPADDRTAEPNPSAPAQERTRWGSGQEISYSDSPVRRSPPTEPPPRPSDRYAEPALQEYPARSG